MGVTNPAGENETILAAPPAVSATPAAMERGPAVWPLHPVLFAAASAMALYVTNLRETSFVDIAPTLATVVAAALVIYLAFAAIFRTFGPRAAIAGSVVLVGGLYYSDAFSRLDRLLGGALPADAALPVMLGLVALLLLALVFVRFSLVLPNALLNGIALVLFLTPAWKAASYHWEAAGLDRVSAADAPQAAVSPGGSGAAIAAPATGELPDIYYFIFDRYGSERTLDRVYGFDNRPFLDFLEEKGFYVASDSHSNYLKTAPSLASTFQMDYLDFLVDDPLAKRNEWHPIYDLLEDHKVGRFLRSKGYSFVQVGGWWAPTQRNRRADENVSFGFSEFGWLYLRRTMLPELVEAAAPDTRFARQLDWDNAQCQRVPQQIEKAKSIRKRPEPTFTFMHVLLPHEPYVFDAEGNCLALDQVRKRGQKTGYVGQLRYANSLIADFVETALAGDGPKPIIIVQADEGPYPEIYRTGNRSWRRATPAQLDTKSGILNAYYFPDGDYSALYETITPVNSFRVLFNKYFGTDHALLPDRIYAFPDYSKIYDFFDVTEKVRRAAVPEG